MAFLHPALLLGLPAVLIPLIIHLINRRRFQKKSWGAMLFLQEALRKNRGRRQVKHWIILAARMLAVVLLVLAMSRPLVGGWVGQWLGVTDVDLVILTDRSPSMGMQTSGRVDSKHELAMELFDSELENLSLIAHVADSADLSVRKVSSHSEFLGKPLSGVAMDVSVLLLQALDHWSEAGLGEGEIWMASDCRESDWKPDDSRWSEVRARIAGMSTVPVFRLLTLRHHDAPNIAISCHGAQRDPANPSRALLDLKLTSSEEVASQDRKVPLTVRMGDLTSNHLISLSEGSLQVQLGIALTESEAGVIQEGSIELPADGNAADNKAYFAVEPLVSKRVVVVSDDPKQRNLLALAVAPGKRAAVDEVIQVSVQNSTKVITKETAFVVWHGRLPKGEGKNELEAFVREGGSALIVSSNQAVGGEWQGWRFKEVREGARAMGRWERSEGPLADALDGAPLPLDGLRVVKSVALEGGEGTVLARFSNGEPLLVRKDWGRGRAYLLATSSETTWSTLGEGWVLVPMLQRMLEEGSQRFRRVHWRSCGEVENGSKGQWIAQEGAPGERAEHFPGILVQGEDRFVLNHSREEASEGTVTDPQIAKLLPGMRLVTSTPGVPSEKKPRLSREWWQPLLVVLLVVILVEIGLTMPVSSRKPEPLSTIE